MITNSQVSECLFPSPSPSIPLKQAMRKGLALIYTSPCTMEYIRNPDITSKHDGYHCCHCYYPTCRGGTYYRFVVHHDERKRVPAQHRRRDEPAHFIRPTEKHTMVLYRVLPVVYSTILQAQSGQLAPSIIHHSSFMALNPRPGS